MNRFISLQLRTQILILFLMLAVVSLGLIGYASSLYKRADINDAEQLATSLVQSIENEQNEMVSGSEHLLTALSYIPAVQNRDASRVNKIFTDLLAKNTNLSSLSIADANGDLWSSTLPMSERNNISDGKYFMNALKTGRFSSGEFKIGRDGTVPVMSFGLPLKGHNGTISDVAVISFRMTKFGSLLQKRPLPENTSLTLTDHKGIILFSNVSPKLIGTQDKAELFDRMKDGSEQGTFRAPGYTNSKRLFAYQKVILEGESAPYLYVRIGLMEDVILKTHKNQIFISLISMIFLVALMVGIVVYISKRAITDKISKICAATNTLASGDLTIRISDTVKGGELGELGAAFDTLAERLSDDSVRRERAEAEVLAKGLELEHYFNASLDLLCIADTGGTFRRLNPEWEKSLGYTISEFEGHPFMELVHPDDIDATAEALKKLENNNDVHDFTNRFKHRDGSYRWIEWRSARQAGTTTIYSTARDVTNRKKAEAEHLAFERNLMHTQKLESLGVLAGGVAHDFNNILMAIIGNADLALMRINKESPVVENLRNIEKAANRAADLAKQMLAYSGKGKFIIENLNLNNLLEEMLNMLEVSISKKSVMRLSLTPNIPSVEGDATQIRQIVMNLVINASEAIGGKSGVIAITTGCMDCDKDYLKDVWLNENISEGLYVYLEVADSGCGMDKETLEKIFDPFFTTKFTGRGLGMAAVLGIVRGHKGAIKVYSEPGRGTNFKVLLPASDKPAEIFNGEAYKDDWQGSGTVLLADDEETVRGIGKEMLRELGFNTITASDGVEAVELFRTTPDIVIVILDLTMPHMDGEQCFRELKQLNPDVKVIMSSGYNEQEVSQKFAGKRLAGFIQKPYKLSMLKEVLRKVL